MKNQTDALEDLTAAARADLVALSYPDRPWVPAAVAPDGTPVDDVLIVGGGQSGVMIAAWLKREGVTRVSVLDQAPAGAEGPWTTFARMAELRTPKELVGNEFGILNLSVRRWYETRYGKAAWDEIERIPREDWKAYLDWYADTMGVAIENGVRVTGVAEGPGDLLTVETERGGDLVRRFARIVVLATGFDGAGAWRVPDFIADNLPPDRYDHSNGPIDLAALKGKRIGVLGHGASAFDNAVAALESGAASADLCFRRRRLPRVNPHRYLETAGTMTHYPSLSEASRWAIARHFRVYDQPPPVRAFKAALGMKGFGFHPATPWLSVGLRGNAIQVETPHGPMVFDHVILATGAINDLASRAELRNLADAVSLWRERYTPPADEEDERLSCLPYLDDAYAFEPRTEKDEWVRRVFAFNALSAVSHGPHSTSISGHRHAMPRLVRGVTKRLFLDHEEELVAGLKIYRSEDLPVPDDFEEAFLPDELQMVQT